MIKEIQLALLPFESDESQLNVQIRSYLSIKPRSTIQFEILKKSIDARKQQVKIIYKLRVYIDEALALSNSVSFQDNDVSHSSPVHIIGAGPAGLFCALQCIEIGLKPVIFERGKNVRNRRRDLATLNKEGILNEESNYCFGEGGAGTYSDGKLYTRSNKRGNVQRILDLFYLFGAENKIRYESHPHIGTNKLPKIIEAIREKILACGGEIYFNAKLTDLTLSDEKVKGITINEDSNIAVDRLVLATGHSANDIYELLHRKSILIESKPFALGVRIEHPQTIIDATQYHCKTRDAMLPPASYSLVEQVNNRGVFSFCMCPGGIIAPASTKENTVVVNGWSPSKRNNIFANSGMVVSIDQADYKDKSALAGLNFQYQVELKSFEYGGGKYQAPAQRMVDFVNDMYSSTLPSCSYLPGINSSKLSEVLPSFVYQSLGEAFKKFGKKMKGYYTNEAVVVAAESRTSSPVRIPRDPETLAHINISNLYPCAEGAGYAGGIVSAAMDGMKTANAIKNSQ